MRERRLSGVGDGGEGPSGCDWSAERETFQLGGGGGGWRSQIECGERWSLGLGLSQIGDLIANYFHIESNNKKVFHQSIKTNIIKLHYNSEK